MEEKLLIVGIVSFVFAKLAKYLKKKGFLQNKTYFVIWNAAFAVTIGTLVYYVLNFMSKNGIEGGLSAKTFALILAATLGGAWYLANKAAKSEEKENEKLYAVNLDWAETVYFAAFFAAVVMFFFIQAFKIPSASMRDTLLEGDNLFVNKITYGLRIPFMKHKLVHFNQVKRGDVIVFAFPAENKEQINCGGPQYGRDFVKRVIGLPGDVVEVKNKIIYINNKPLDPQPYEKYEDIIRTEQPLPLPHDEYQKIWESRELENYLGIYLRDYFGPVTVPQGQYLVLGDNRDFSCDSRFWGPVPEGNIKGKAWFVHWPISRMKIIK